MSWWRELSPRRRLGAVSLVLLVAAGIGAGAAFAAGSFHGSAPMRGQSPLGDFTGGSMMGGYGSGMMGGYGPGTVGGAGMMGGFAGQEPGSVRSLEAAAERVEAWLSDSGFTGFHPAEVMSFSNGYYVAVDDPQGRGAFELLIDPATGWISPEPGPNMMWNTRYGMMGAVASGPARIQPSEARSIARRWLARVAPGTIPEAPHAFPGYYTLDTERRGRVQGMLSVNARTGAVWYHSWHGRFLAELELEG